MSNKNMISPVAMDDSKAQSILSRVERIYNKQQLLHCKLLEVNKALTNGNTDVEPEPGISCVMDYLEATESVLDTTLGLTDHILRTTI